MVNGLATRDDAEESYLQTLRGLAHEMTVAIHAISANALEVLEESVAKQEMLCAGLAAARGKMCGGMSAAIGSEIRTTGEKVRVLNLQYAALLKHSSRSIAMLAALCRNHTGQFQEARGARLKHQTWSCEM